MVEVITDNLAVWTIALENKSGVGRGSNKKQTAYGIKKLRELILELAVRGKLVPQDPNDEPASVLLEKIAEEKAQLLQEGNIKKQKALPEIGEDEKPFSLPENWQWVQVGGVCVLENGDRSKNYPNKSLLVDSGVPFVNAGHLQNGRINKNNMTFITEDRYDLLKAGKFLDGDILFCLRGSLGKSAIVENFEKGAIASSLVIVRLFNRLSRFYFHHYFDSPFSYSMIKLYDNGTAQPNLSAADLGKFLVPLPPLAEQHRIVAKVDELMALCDQLEQQQTDSLTAHKTLVATLLQTLIDSKNAEQLTQNWAILSQHFGTLFTTEQSIDQLKQTILQLAVMGKLVPQDPNDEPASILLEKIAEEKAQLVKEGKIKRQKVLPEIGEDKKPFDLPKEWKWVNLGDVTQIKGGKRVSNGYKLLSEPTPYIYIRVSDMKNGAIDDSDLRYIDKDMREKIKQYIITEDDLYMTIVGATIGKCGIVPTKFNQMNLTENAARLILFDGCKKEFLLKCLESEFCQSQFFDKTKQVGVQKMALNRLGMNTN